MKLSIALRKKAFPLILMYSIASILCCLTVPLMVPMTTASPDGVTFWIEPNVKTGVTPDDPVEVHIYINATGDTPWTAIIGWKVDIAVNPDVLEIGYYFEGYGTFWAVGGDYDFFLYDWAEPRGNDTSFDQGKNSTTAGTIIDIVENVDNWANFPQGTGANGTNQKLCTLYFTSKSASAYSPIRIKNARYYTSWNAPEPDEREPNVIHGHYNSPTGIHDVVVRSVATSAPSVHRGDMVYFSTETYNPGAYTENFNVTFSYNKTAIQWESIGNYTFTLDPLENKTKPFLTPPIWDTEYTEPGNYIIGASAILAGDVNSTNNVANTTILIKPPLYDVAVTAISTNTTTATSGDTVEINVTAANLGTAEPVNLTVTVSYNPQIGEDNATLVANVTGTADFTFNWNTAGVSADTYNITARVSLWTKVGWDDKIEFNDENKTTITIIPAVRDVAVTNVVPLENEGYPTWTIHGIDINITVLNNGTGTMSFNVTAYYGSSTWYEIGMQPVTSLGEGANKTLTFNWNLSGFAYGVYDIKANATLDGDIYLYNNEVTVYDAVKVKRVGDVDGNNYVGSWDLILLAAAYGSDLGDPDWNRQADFDDDTHVGSWDLISLAAAYGTSY